MEDIKVYILKVEYYGELAQECGASDILGVYRYEKDCIRDLKLHLKDELNDNHIIEDKKTIKLIDENIKELQNNNMTIRFCGYISEYNYEHNNSEFEYIIEEKEII